MDDGGGGGDSDDDDVVLEDSISLGCTIPVEMLSTELYPHPPCGSHFKSAPK